jgi:tetratricopeptide (TPR) repeat protein
VRVVLHDRVIDLESGHVEGAERLTQFECSLLQYLHAHTDQAISRDRLLVDVWGYPRPVVTRCVDTAVRRVRKKIEEEPKSPRHLLTIQGEGYRWWDGGAALVSQDDRCCGRQRWSEQLAWAEAAFGASLDPHDPRVGISDVIGAAYAQEAATLGQEARALLDLLSLCRDGWTPTELGEHADLGALRTLVHNGWAEVDGPRIRLGALWWPVRGGGEPARNRAVELWIRRLGEATSVDLLEVLAAHAWPELSTDRAADLVAAARQPAMEAGFAHPLIRAAEALLGRELADPQRVSIHLVRGIGLFRIGLFGEARRSAEQALALDDRLPEVRPEVLGFAGVLAHVTGALELAEQRYRAVIARDGDHALTARTDLARVHWALGRTEEAIVACQASLTAAVLAGKEAPRRHASRALGWMSLGAGQHLEAISRLSSLYELDRDGHPLHASTVATYLGLAYLDQGEIERATPWLAAARDHAHAGGGRSAIAMSDHALGIAAALQGSWDEANALQFRSLTALEDAQMDPDNSRARCWAAVGLARIGDAQGAVAMLGVVRARIGDRSAWPDRVLFARTCEALGLSGVVLPKGADQVIDARLMQRALRHDPITDLGSLTSHTWR